MTQPIDDEFEQLRKIYAEGNQEHDAAMMTSYDRAQIEAQHADNDRKIAALAQAGVPINYGEVMMVRIRAMCDHIIGDMDNQARLAFESALADTMSKIITATAAQAGGHIAANGGRTASGLHIPRPGEVR